MKILNLCLLVTLHFPIVLARIEPTSDHEQLMSEETNDAEHKASDLTQQHRSLWLWGRQSCPSEADICRSYWWDIFGWFTGYTVQNPDTCDSKCSSHLGNHLDNGWVCQSEVSTCKTKVVFVFDQGGLDEADTNNDNDPVRGRVLIEELVKDLGGNIEGTFQFQDDIFVLPEKMDELVRFTDKTLEETLARGVDTIFKGVPIKNDFQFDIMAETLKSLIGMENVRAVYKFYQEYDPGFPVSRIALRRVDFPDTEMHLDWHVDGEGNMVSHVFLNEVMEGGSNTFVSPDGIKEVVAHKGTALVHGKNVIHGIKSFKGKRYTLLFVGDNRNAKDIVKELIDQEVSMVA